MSSAVPIVTVFGGSGFVGRYVTQRLARAGWRVRVAVRRPDEALFVRTYGTVGQVEPIQANIRDENSVRAAIAGSQAVVNCVGILVATGKQTFDAVVAEGAGRIARIAAAENVSKFIHISAIGADASSESNYFRCKAEGEAAVTAAFPNAVILRPSVIFGTEDDFFNRFAGFARLTPVLPIVSPDTRMQPVYVDDVAAAAAKAVTADVASGVYELGGPEVLSFRSLIENLLSVIERKRFIVALPTGLARIQGRVLDFAQRMAFDLFPNRIITADQVEMLQTDSIVSDSARGFSGLGIEPTAMEAVMDGYLYPYRPHGQFDAITASAANLRD